MKGWIAQTCQWAKSNTNICPNSKTNVNAYRSIMWGSLIHLTFSLKNSQTFMVEERNFPRDLIKVKVQRSIIWNLVSNNYLWPEFKITYKENFKRLSSRIWQISFEFLNILVLTSVHHAPLSHLLNSTKYNRWDQEGPPSLALQRWSKCQIKEAFRMTMN